MKKIFVLITCIMLTMFCALSAWIDWIKVNEVKTWHEINATVVSTDIKEYVRSKGKSFCPEIAVKYEFQGIKESTLQLANGPCRPIKTTLKSVIDKYKVGSDVVAFVNPKNPIEIRLATFALGPTFYLSVLAFFISFATSILSTKSLLKRKTRK